MAELNTALLLSERYNKINRTHYTNPIYVCTHKYIKEHTYINPANYRKVGTACCRCVETFVTVNIVKVHTHVKLLSPFNGKRKWLAIKKSSEIFVCILGNKIDFIRHLDIQSTNII